MKKIAVMMLALILIINSTMTVKAASYTRGATAWELLMTLLMSAGANVELSDAFIHVPAGVDEEMYRAFVKQNNQAELQATYQAIEKAALQGIANGYTTLKLSKEAWDSFKSWAQDSALKGLTLGITTTTTMVYETQDALANAIGINPKSEVMPIIWKGYIDADDGAVTVLRNIYVDSNGTESLMYHIIVGYQNDVDSYDIKDITNNSFVISGSLWTYTWAQMQQDGITLKQHRYGFDRLPGQGSTDYKSEWSLGKDMTMLFNEDVVINQKEIGELVSVFPADVGITDVVTPGRTKAEDGTLVGDVTIAVPQGLSITDTLAKVRAGTLTETQALSQVGVVPVDMTKDKVITKEDEEEKTVAQAIEGVASSSSFSGLTADLSQIFPFCLPFDFVHFIECLKADPEAPSFTWQFPCVNDKGDIVYIEQTISLSAFDDVAFWVRKMELFAFCVGLVYVTRSMFIRS